MNRAMKAALLSGFVFPGAGQIYLKRYGRGSIMMLVALAALIIMVAKAASSALKAVNTLPVVGQPPDMNDIANIAVSSSSDIFAGLGPLLYLLAACWIVSILDAYRTGADPGIGVR